ncbi:MAG: PKD domain-containing protein [Dehalococcoidia bacterium]|nr:PKD domain-containing protein [Dehalococcoidia bacterium]
MHRFFLLVLALLLLVAGCAGSPPPIAASAPAADFEANPREGLAPLVVSFADLSTGDVTHWHWDFGDGQFSAEPEPDHTYASAGDYTVSLAVMGPGGSDVKTEVNYVEVRHEVINWEEAGSYIGQKMVVEGIVVGTYYHESGRGEPTFLDFHKPYEGYFKCVIWGSDRGKFVKEFPPNPETYFLDRRVRVAGLVEEYPEGSGVPEIILSDPSQIEVVEE